MDFNDASVYIRRLYTWRPLCGNGVIDSGETFDEGQPWDSFELGANCGATCGDAVHQSGEGCDDANDIETDSCLSSCITAGCGDGIVRADLEVGEAGFESCDDGNADPWDGCGNVCNRCGDGIIGRFETCDDQNELADDGCTNCILDTCGDGVLDEGEDCDGGIDATCPVNCRVFTACAEFWGATRVS